MSYVNQLDNSSRWAFTSPRVRCLREAGMAAVRGCRLPTRLAVRPRFPGVPILRVPHSLRTPFAVFSYGAATYLLTIRTNRNRR